VIWGGKKLGDEEIDLLYRVVFGDGHGPVVLAHLLTYECHVWDEIEPDAQLVALQNLGKKILKRVGEIREDRIVDLTRRCITLTAPTPLREEKEKP